jgi:flagellar biosynthesis/type III secretory pathway M-ring protein FliF/YscJ
MSPWDTGDLHYFTTPTWGTSSSSSSANTAGEPLKEDSTIKTSSGSSGTKSTKHSNNTIIIAVVVAVVAALILLTALICVIRCCRRRSRKRADQKDRNAMGGFLNRGWQKVDGEEKLGDEDFGGQSYNARDKLLNQDVPVYNARGMAYEPFRPVGGAAA